jgi:Ni/Co efflux regulator RcnB
LPHVTLAWRQFDLPEPPPGRLYARVGRDVLLITAAGRIVESVLPPG